ncbi:hypothetical protein TNCT1_56530 [Streptomyces sp. 1-11]|nr:hypothetical protein TNCT1_56530 [Streptomyces sp. 1-11]
MSKSAEMGHYESGRSLASVMGGTMKLGKALATGVAEERPVAHQEEPELPRETNRTGTTRTAPAEPAREEVPAAR